MILGAPRLGAVAAAALACACTRAPGARSSGESPTTAHALRVTSDSMDGRLWLAKASAQAIGAGSGPLQVIGADVVSEGDRVGAFVEIPDSACVLAIARTSPTITDVDLFSYDDAGSTFASDETPEADAALMICPPHPRRLYVAARVMSGAGILGLGVHLVPRGVSEAVARAVGARTGASGESGRLESWPGLEAKIREHRAWLGSRWEDVRRVAIPVDPRAASRLSVTIDAGRCLDVLVTPSDEVTSLEVVAEDTTARIVARGRERGRDRSLVLCSAIASNLTLAVRPRASQGLAAVVVGRSPVGAEAEISQAARVDQVTETRELPQARAFHERSIAGRGYGAAKTVATGSARVGSRVTVPLELPQGCSRIDVVAGRPLVSVQAELWDDRGVQIAEGRGGATATLFGCGAAGPMRLDIEALARPGPFAVELRRERAAPATLVAHPVAASRLLARRNAGGGVADVAALSAVQVIRLDAQTLKILPVVVAAHTCVEIIAAADSGGSGVDLRLVDSSSGESTLTRARYVVSDRICAGDVAKPGKVELRLAAGEADVLILTHPAH